MDAKELIDKILSDKSIYGTSIFPDKDTWEAQFKNYIKIIHHDVCKLPNAEKAEVKLLSFKDAFKKGTAFVDDAGNANYTHNLITFKGDYKALQKSHKNFKVLTTQFTSQEDRNFYRYLAVNMALGKNELLLPMTYTAVPLSKLIPLPQEHINWILSRMLELIAWFDKIGYCHLGINPDSIFVVPERHGIICTSFYHMTKTGSTIKTISGRYRSFYPDQLITKKKANIAIDIECAKTTARQLYGIPSIYELAKKVKPEYISFLNTFDKDSAFDVFKKYRKLLADNFPKKYYKLVI